jgi:AbrB family looped-hinge helix DNA binding protein
VGFHKINIAPHANLDYYNLTAILLKGDAMETTRLSERGQIVIPKRVREAHGWEPGLEFIVEDTGDSIKLKPIKAFKKTTVEDVLGCLHYKGPRKSLKDMEAAIAKGAKESK